MPRGRLYTYAQLAISLPDIVIFPLILEQSGKIGPVSAFQEADVYPALLALWTNNIR